jgi:ribosomal-protein-alanine N-acetyltransferase
MTAKEAVDIERWRYEDVGEVPRVGRPGDEDFTARDGVSVVGYCSFGRTAMIPHYLDEDNFVGVAWGLRPDLVGRDNGTKFVEAIIELGSQRYYPRRLQAVIKRTNGRSLKSAEDAGLFQVDEVSGRIVLQQPGLSATDRA